LVLFSSEVSLSNIDALILQLNYVFMGQPAMKKIRPEDLKITGFHRSFLKI
jgi:hypothetical protein